MMRTIKRCAVIFALLLAFAALFSCQGETASGHNHTEAVRTEEITPPTCLAGGTYTEITYCSECDEEIKREEKTSDSLGHSYLLCECTGCGDILASEGLEFTENAIGGYTVTGIGSCTDTAIYIPSEYMGETVVAIGDGAFYSSRITEVHLPITILRIGENAFAKCKSLTTVEVGTELAFIGRDAFASSGSIKKTEHLGGLYLGCEENPYVILLDAKSSSAGVSGFAEGVRCIYSSALDGAGMESVILPDGVVSIGDRAFANMRSLKTVYIPRSVSYIGSEPFALSSQITEITVAEGNYTYKSLNGALYNRSADTLIQAAAGSLSGDVILPEGLVRIEPYAIFGATSLVSLTLPDGFSQMGAFALSGCSSLKNLYIPDSISGIGDGALSGCNSLVYLTEDEAVFLGSAENPYAVLVSLRNKAKTSYEIPDRTRVILANAFYNCSMLTNITVPHSVRYIGTSAFQYCQSAESVNIGASVTYIGASAFYGCTGFRNLVIPNSVTYIGESAFRGCIRIRSVAMSNSITSLSVSVFSYCERITSVTIPTKVTRIEASAFMYCTRLESVFLPTGLEYIGDEAFRECSRLSYISIPGGVKTIGAGAFRSCTSLKTAMLGEGIENIKDVAFAYCSALVNINIPSTVYAIGGDTFTECPALAFNEYGGCLYLGNNNNPYLYLYKVAPTSVSVMLSDSLSFIRDGAFLGASLGYNEYEGGLYLGSETNPYLLFVGMKDNTLTESKIHDNTKMIASGAYEGCSALKSVVIGAAVEYIGAMAFDSLASLERVEFKTVRSWQVCDFYSDETILLYGSDVADAERMADLLSGSYSEYEWRADALPD